MASSRSNRKYDPTREIDEAIAAVINGSASGRRRGREASPLARPRAAEAARRTTVSHQRAMRALAVKFPDEFARYLAMAKNAVANERGPLPGDPCPQCGDAAVVGLPEGHTRSCKHRELEA
jgi:hypothetical protein